MQSYIKVTGSTQGAFKGGCTQKNHSGESIVLASSHAIIAPRDAASGLASGKRQHEPFTIIKELDPSTINFYTAICHNEVLKKVVISVWANIATGGVAVGTGELKLTYTVELENAVVANITSIEQNQVGTSGKPELISPYEIYGRITSPYFEKISFTYQKITCTWVNGGVTFTDDWTLVT
jgi:type VI secretion system secreted protein Hcp